MTCDVCGLPDPYNGDGDGIGSCDCPRCDCGSACGSVFCDCDPVDCCGDPMCGGCYDDDEPWPDDVFVPVDTIQPSETYL